MNTKKDYMEMREDYETVCLEMEEAIRLLEEEIAQDRRKKDLRVVVDGYFGSGGAAVGRRDTELAASSEHSGQQQETQLPQGHRPVIKNQERESG